MEVIIYRFIRINRQTDGQTDMETRRCVSRHIFGLFSIVVLPCFQFFILHHLCRLFNPSFPILYSYC